MMGLLKMYIFGFIFLNYQIYASLSEINDERTFENDEFPISDEIKNMIGKTFNFSNLIMNTNGVQLSLNGKPIDLSAIHVDSTNVKQLNIMQRGRNISEFFYVASHLAGIEARIASREGENTTTLPLENIFGSDTDTVFGAEDVDELVREITQSPDHLNLGHSSGSTDPRQANPSGKSSSTQRSSRKKRKAVAFDEYRWSSTIPYVIAADFDNYPSTVNIIKQGLQQWEDETCLTFQQVSDFNGSHIIFIRMQGCWSNVGKQYWSAGQYISIGPGCETPGIVAHEVGHALGFRHEHQRPDRDQYVTINYQNIMQGRVSNFIIRSWRDDLTEGVPYDYSSIMHYLLGTFSSNGQQTITPKEEDMETLTGSQDFLSYFDSKLANLLYCRDRCPEGLDWSACQNGGYRDPKDCSRCRCPDGWSGSDCTKLKPAVNANCGQAELEATESWNTMTSPGYDAVSGFPGNAECTYRIKTSKDNMKIVVRFTDQFRLPCNRIYGPCVSYIEIRYKNLSRPGPRYCCADDIRKDFVSHGKEVLLLLRSKTARYPTRGFKIEYRLESCGCSSNDDDTPVLACLTTESYSCPVYVQECFNTGCEQRERKNTCYREVAKCCDDRELIGNTCHKRWSSWTEWTPCSKTCGSGSQTRSRSCVRSPCSGPSEESQTCNNNSCAVSVANWSEWAEWSACTRSCGDGIRSRNRACLTQPCSGLPYQIQDCNDGSCLGTWAKWNEWSTCSTTCGSGIRTRNRACPSPPCSGLGTSASRCYQSDCPVEKWSEWSTCSVTCGSGIRTRDRTCSTPPCSGSHSTAESCWTGVCPGQLSNWYQWSSCSKSCGSGTRSRYRNCVKSPCSEPTVENEACNSNKCPVVSSLWSSWSPWTECPSSCGSGLQVRARACITQTCRESAIETKRCSKSPCPSQWSSWSQWGSCSKSCGTGGRTRTRTCTAGTCSGLPIETDTCNTAACPSRPWCTKRLRCDDRFGRTQYCTRYFAC